MVWRILSQLNTNRRRVARRKKSQMRHPVPRLPVEEDEPPLAEEPPLRRVAMAFRY